MKILLIKTSSLGDIIQTFPVISYLRHRFPEGQIDWVVENSFAEMLRAHPMVDRVLTVESKKWRNLLQKECRLQLGAFRKKLRQTEYDILFDLQGNIKSSAIVVNARAKEKVGFGWRTVSEWPNTLCTTSKINPSHGKNIREDYLAIVQGYFKDLSPFEYHPVLLKLEPLQQQRLADLFSHTQRPVLVCPFSAWPNKCLSEEKLIQFLADLKRGPYWFIWGSQQE